jgi:hypothetical protein
VGAVWQECAAISGDLLPIRIWDNQEAEKMKPENRSPRITKLSWGLLEVDGQTKYKDAKLFPGGVRAWDWRETGTRHTPGIQPTDVVELLERGATVVILSMGMNRRLQVMTETLQVLRERGIAVHVLQTEEAVQRYNELRRNALVGGLFHSTC